MGKFFDGATGALVEHVPPGAARDELLMLIRLGIPFARQQQIGKCHGFLHNYLVEIVPKLDKPTFKNLLDELRLATKRREGDDGRHEPIERVSSSMGCVIYHHPRLGEQEIPFSTLRNRLTAAKKELKNKKFPLTPNP